ncbi:MAG: helix-turn-helix domain-containing protein [Acidiferrobacterales bacterium]
MDTIPPSAESLLRQIADQVRKQRVKHHLAQSVLAAQAGISRQTLIALESGQGVSGQSLLSVMAVLGLGVVVMPPVVASTSARPTIKSLMRDQRVRNASAGL